MEAVEGFICRHCGAYIPLLETASVHECFKNKDVYVDNNNVLFVHDNLDGHDKPCNDYEKTNTIESSEQSTKQSAVWTDKAIMALLSLYEANVHMLDHPKKKTKIWTAVSDGLKDFEIEMSPDQVRWKMNILQKKYKECCDNNNKSGRGKMEFKWYDQLDEIFGRNKDAIAAHTVSSKIIKQASESTLSSQKNIGNCTSESPSSAEIPATPIASTSLSINNKNAKKQFRIRRGTGSNLADKKLNIEHQWLKFLENKEVRDTERDKRIAKSEERTTESFTLKKKLIALKRQEIEQKRELLNKKLKDKENRHAEIIQIEKTKCKLLKKLLYQTNLKISDDSDE
ncbi:uncharacterized protein LOC118646467 isoform X1 [Monomorium pharaonis]|uniref:uncharacterized protein LOC118646467 isoform X1 n=1 Tax=Monomorium pharaonis TaxID=307658 RepID=UPI001746956E|nr:uncharacterized protein LOC118646467 isoform X1 [Monomorium pharaonis]